MKALIMSELRQRIRGKRWWILLGIWFLALLGLVLLVRGATRRALEFNPDTNVEVGAIMFGSLALFILALSCLVVPSLTATSINGERDRGTLAILQATLLQPWQIVAAKSIAAAIATAAFLIATVPIGLWCMANGGVGLKRGAAVYLTLFVVSIVLLAGGVMASSIVRRPALSAVLAYGFVFLLTIGTFILFGVSMATAQFSNDGPDYGPRWLIVAPNPFIVLADAGPVGGGDEIDDPLSGMRAWIREIRTPPPSSGRLGGPVELLPEEQETPPPVWPYGLAIELAFAALAFYVATNRLHVPAKRLPRGERIA